MATHPHERDDRISRRQILRGSVGGAIAILLAACANLEEAARLLQQSEQESVADLPTSLPPTPACGDDDEPEVTASNPQGPFFTPNSPQRTNLREEGTAGTPLVVEGLVLTTGCRPVAGALLDFWQADDAGQYDNVGYHLRGHQFSAEDGSYRLETILPGLYPGRTRHIHVKAQVPNAPVLVTQLYFSGEAQNAQDALFLPSLAMPVEETADGLRSRFVFVLET